MPVKQGTKHQSRGQGGGVGEGRGKRGGAVGGGARSAAKRKKQSRLRVAKNEPQCEPGSNRKGCGAIGHRADDGTANRNQPGEKPGICAGREQ